MLAPGFWNKVYTVLPYMETDCASVAEKIEREAKFQGIWAIRI